MEKMEEKPRSTGVFLSKTVAGVILFIWVAITVAIALMVAFLAPKCSDDLPHLQPSMNEPSVIEPSVKEKSIVVQSLSTTASPVKTARQNSLSAANTLWTEPFLADQIRPVHYDLWFNPDFYYDGSTFEGKENITISVGIETKYLIVHYKMMNITSTRVWVEGSTELTVVNAFAYDDNEYWVAELASNVTAGTSVVMHLEFQGSLVNGIVGYYKSTYVNQDTGVQSWLATTKFQPTDARKAFPNFDEPKFKATFTVTLRHWQNFTALSNMPNESMTILDNMWQETHFEISPNMSSYLVCFIVCDFKYKSNTLENGKTHRIWATPDKINQVDFALSMGKNLTDYFEKQFNMTFHLPKLDQVAVPDYPSGATEHWGLVTYRESRLLYDPATASASNQQSVAEIISHELAHNYFGDAVTCYWWNDIWLNEGFASFYEEMALGDLKPEYEAADGFVVRTEQPIMESDAETESRAITKNVTHPDEINSAFSSVVYSKGASILRMLEHIMGKEQFLQGVRFYLKKYEYGSVTTSDFFQTMAESINNALDIPTLMNPWVEQMGLPVINLTQGPGGELVATQSRFLNDPEATYNASESIHGYKWWVPLTYRTNSNTEAVVWMNKTGATFTDPRNGEEWLYANPQQYGFYRVNYDAVMWKNLADELENRPATFAAVERATILNDAFNLARATQLDYPTTLALTSYMESEEHYFPWTSSASGFSYISRMMSNDGQYDLWRDYIKDLTSPIMNLLGIRGDGEHLDILNREKNIIPLACNHGNKECAQNTTLLFIEWIKNQLYWISPNIRRVVYRYGMQFSGSDEIWNTAWARYETAATQEKDNIAYSLAQASNMWLIQRYLDYAMDPAKIRTQDFFTVINYIAANPNANNYLWDWTRANYDTLVQRFGTSDRYFGSMVPNMVYYYNTEFQLEEVVEFYAKYPDAGAGAQAREESLSSIQSNIAWVQLNKQPIIDWLKLRPASKRY